MKSRGIRVVVILAAVSIIGIVVTQYYWFTKAFNVEEEQFNREVNTALYNVAHRFFEINQSAGPTENPIRQLSTNYYVVMINNEIDANLLEYLLKSEFEKRKIEADFEYGIYDCTSDKMVYGNYVSLDNKEKSSGDGTLPQWNNQNYYFGVQFPNKASIITNKMGIWIFSSSVLLVVIIFFAYALVVILKQKRLSEIQTDFINNMTHEFKTPISTIALSADVIKDKAIVDQPQRLLNYATIIQNENQRLKNQVERVLQMASIEKEDIGLKKELIDMHAIIHEATTGITLVQEDKAERVQLELNARQSEIVGDKLHLTNVIFNLLDNAFKYTKKDPEIVVTTTSDDKKLMIAIKDNGIGIEAEHQKRIFNKFYRVPTGNLHDVKGFGLGLNYVALIVKAHKGMVDMESTPGKGTTFYLKFNYG